MVHARTNSITYGNTFVASAKTDTQLNSPFLGPLLAGCNNLNTGIYQSRNLELICTYLAKDIYTENLRMRDFISCHSPLFD